MAYGFTYTLPTITGSHSDFPVLLREDDFPSAAIDGGSSSILNGGGNLRAYTSSAKTTRLPIEVVSFVAGGTPAAEVWVKIPTAATSSTIYIEADAVETTQPAVTNAYGRNAVWSDYEAVLHLIDSSYTDSTGNGHDGSLTLGVDQSFITAGHPRGGVWADFDGAKVVSLASSADAIDSSPFTISCWAEIDTAWTLQDGDGLLGNWYAADNAHYAQLKASSAGMTKAAVTQNTAIKGERPTGTPTLIVLTQDVSALRLYENAINVASDTAVIDGEGIASINNFRIGTYYDDATTRRLDGRVGDARIRRSVLQADWISTEYANQSASGAWGTVGSWADSGGGVSASIGLVTETSAAFSMAASKSMPVGLAGEADSALSLTAGHVVTTGQAVSAELAFSLSWSKLLAIGLAAESDSALSMSYSASTVVPIGITTEADSALQMARAKTLAIGQSDETDTALSVAAQKSLPIGLSGEVDSALAVSIAKALSLDIAVEADTALAFAYPQTIAIGVSQETDQALSFSVSLAGGVIAAARATRHTYTSRPSHTASSRPAAISRSRRH